ncbi:MAG TPA: protein kinase [Gemmatimonadales bacterium]|jgi:serine/threonine-protein kinase|nr:protein kinase [Gemmatimonadales bacterium]
MSDLQERLTHALSDRYAVTGELGRGGMAVVFLAHDIRHGRDVAIKVLSPELAASLGHQRFVREVRVAARLSHPGIVPLYDSGDSDGLLFYVMPVVRGESLAARLRREGPLPLEEALAIGAEVAEALDYAGKQGVVHRDIKPGNILLSGGHALVADFGLAHALEQDQAVLTSSGLVVGTPMYMSPEQVGTSSRLDARSDQYSLGCVLYEMLVGEPPFTGASVQQVFARHAVERVPSIRAVRDSVPEIIEGAIHRALAKNPADRFPSSGDFARVLRGESFPAWSRASLAIAAPARKRPWLIPALLVLLVIGGVATWRIVAGRTAALPPDPARIAVLPLGAANPGDSVAASAGLALANLLADRFTGLGGPRAAEASGVRAALQQLDAMSGSLAQQQITMLASDLGTGLVLRGQVLASGDSLNVTATIESAIDGTELARVTNVSESVARLGPLADRIAAGLLASLAGEPADRMAVLQRASLASLRPFLQAEQEFAGGHYAAAASHYAEAIGRDSSLAVAGIGWLLAGQLSNNDDVDSVTRWLKAQRGNLPPADARFLPCLNRWFLPETIPVNVRDTMAYYSLCETATVAPGRPDIWLQLGLVLNQQTWAGLPGARDRAAAAFRKALEIDSSYVPAMGHLLDIDAARGDSASVRRLGTRYLALDKDGDLAAYYRWLIAAALGDSTTLKAFRSTMPTQSHSTLDRLISAAEVEGVGIDDAVAATRELQRRSGTRGDLTRAYQRRMELALNLGQPAEAAQLMRDAAAADATGLYHDFATVFSALYWDGDTTLAAETIARFAPEVAELVAGRDVPTAPQQLATVGMALWLAAHEEWDRIPLLMAVLERVLPEERDDVVDICLRVLEARRAVRNHSPSAGRLIAELDAPRVLDPFLNSWAVALGNLTLAELYSERGDYAKALNVVGRRPPVADAGAQRVQVALSTLFREEGRLAALTGDKARARSAYGHYLALRADAEPSLRAEVEQVKAEVAALE